MLYFPALANAETITLTENGASRAVIVVPSPCAPEVVAAATVLRDHLQFISGAEISIRKEDEVSGPASENRPLILVGEGRRVKELGIGSEGLKPGGIFLKAKENALVLIGKITEDEPMAAQYAVTQFLELKLGVRYLWPGDLGKVIPRRQTIKLDAFEYSYSPKLAQRSIRIMAHHDRLQVGLDRLGVTAQTYEAAMAGATSTSTPSPDWARWNGLGGRLNLEGGHAFGGYWAQYGKEHPDWFALQPDGSRDQSRGPERARLCKSNPELIAAVAKNKIDELNRKPALRGVSIGPNDGGGTYFCVCPKCEALDAPAGRKVKFGETEHVSYTDRVVYFWNAIAEQVAKAHPDKFLLVDVYSVYSAPPLLRTLHPNLLLRYSAIGGYIDQAAREIEMKDFDAWTQAAKHFFWRPNLMGEGRRTGFPLLYVHRVAEDFKHVVAGGAMGTDFDGICQHWATQGLNYYVVARLNWDTSQNVDEIIDDYCRAGFGPGAKSVRRYFDMLENARNEAIEIKIEQNSAISLKLIPELKKCLEQARAEIGPEKEFAERLSFIELGLRWSEIQARAHASAKGSAELKIASEERFALMKEIFRKSPLAVNVGYVLWGDGMGP